jgi:hypothetical protein
MLRIVCLLYSPNSQSLVVIFTPLSILSILKIFAAFAFPSRIISVVSILLLVKPLQRRRRSSNLCKTTSSRMTSSEELQVSCAKSFVLHSLTLTKVLILNCLKLIKQ